MLIAKKSDGLVMVLSSLVSGSITLNFDDAIGVIFSEEM